MGNSSNKSKKLNVADSNEKSKKLPPAKRKQVKEERRKGPANGKKPAVIKKTKKDEPVFQPVASPVRQIDSDDVVLNRLRKSLRTDFDTFVLNNILMSVQLFDNFEREISVLRKSPVSDVELDRSNQLGKFQRHCVSPDKLHDLVSKRVRFRHQHGSKKHCTEYIHSPRLMVVQDNVELYEGTDSVDYSSVAVGPTYRLTMEDALSEGHVKLRYDDRRRPTYEQILQNQRKSEEEVSYSRIGGDTPSPRGSDETPQAIQEEDEEDLEEMPQLTEGQKMMIDLQEHIETGKKDIFKSTNGLATDSIALGETDAYGYMKPEPRRLFGPQSNFQESKYNVATPTERKLSGLGIMKNANSPKFVSPFPKRQNKLKAVNSKSMPNLTETGVLIPPSSRGSPQSESSGYKSGGSSYRTNLSLPNSRGSELTDYGYATITSFSTPAPLEHRRLGHIPDNLSTIPDECFSPVEIALINKDVNKQKDDSGAYILTEKLFETRYYLNSSRFVGSFADVFAVELAGFLGIPADILESATMQGAEILYDMHEQGPNKIPLKIHNKIIPTITSASWPNAAFEWGFRSRNVITDKVNHVAYTWPTQRMVSQIKSFGCHVLPVGFMPTRGENVERDFEWRLAFPEAERYLESCLSHAQVRCFIFTLALYKNFMEPVTAELGLTTENIRTLLLWQCEKNYVSWPEDRPGETLQKFLNILYDALMKETIQDYFIKSRNQLEGVPRSHIRRVQERLCRIRENLIMHVLRMVRNLRYVDETNFYPQLDFKRLYKILTVENIVELANPKLARSISQQKVDDTESEEDSDEESATDMWAEVRKNDPGRQWNKKVNRQIVAEKAALQLTSEFTRKSIDSIDLLTIPGKVPDQVRRTMLLELLIPHFMEMAKRSNEFRAPKQSLMYIQHAERLTKLLGEEQTNDGAARKLIFQIKNLRDGGMVGIDELRSPTTVQSYNYSPKRTSFRQPDSPTSLITMDLPPIPGSETETKTKSPRTPVKSAGLKRIDYMSMEENVHNNVHGSKNGFTNNKNRQSIVFNDVEMKGESTDF